MYDDLAHSLTYHIILATHLPCFLAIEIIRSHITIPTYDFGEIGISPDQPRTIRSQTQKCTTFTMAKNPSLSYHPPMPSEIRLQLHQYNLFLSTILQSSSSIRSQACVQIIDSLLIGSSHNPTPTVKGIETLHYY